MVLIFLPAFFFFFLSFRSYSQVASHRHLPFLYRKGQENNKLTSEQEDRIGWKTEPWANEDLIELFTVRMVCGQWRERTVQQQPEWIWGGEGACCEEVWFANLWAKFLLDYMLGDEGGDRMEKRRRTNICLVGRREPSQGGICFPYFPAID